MAGSNFQYIFEVLYQSNLGEAQADFGAFEQRARQSAGALGELVAAMKDLQAGDAVGLRNVIAGFEALNGEIALTPGTLAEVRASIAALIGELEGGRVGVFNSPLFDTQGTLAGLRQIRAALDGDLTALEANTAATRAQAGAEGQVAANAAKTTAELQKQLGVAVATQKAAEAAARAGLKTPLIPSGGGEDEKQRLVAISPVDAAGGRFTPLPFTKEVFETDIATGPALAQARLSNDEGLLVPRSAGELDDRTNIARASQALRDLERLAAEVGTQVRSSGQTSAYWAQYAAEMGVVKTTAAQIEKAEAAGALSTSQWAATEQAIASSKQRLLGLQEKAEALAARQQAAQAKELAAQQAAAGGGGKKGGFFGGFTGSASFNDGFLAQAGATFKYLALYEGFVLITRALAESFDQLAAYDRAVTNLSLAMGVAHDQAVPLANELTRIGRGGGLASAQAINAGVSYARAFDNAPGSATAGTSTATMLNIIGDPKTVDANSQQVLATLQNFQLGVSGYTRTLDAATSAAQQFGLAGPNDILPGLAQIGDLAKATGFSLEETASLIGAIRQRTGESADAAAGELRRILGREGNPAFQQVFSQYGVSLTQSFRDQLAQFAPIFNQLSSQGKAAVIGQIGGGRAGAAGEVIAEFKDIEEAAKKAQDSGGIATDQFIARLNDLRGLLTLLRQDWNQLFQDLGKSGLLDIFTVPLAALHPFLIGVDSLLQLFNSLPTPIHAVTVAVLELAAALALMNKAGIGPGAIGGVKALASGIRGLNAEKITGFITGAGGIEKSIAAEKVAATAAQDVAYGSYATNLAAGGFGAEATAAEAAAAAGAGATAAGGGGLAAALFNPVTAGIAVAVGGLIAIGAAKSAFDHLNDAADTAANSGFLSATTQEQFRNAASQLKNAATQTQAGFFADFLTNGDASRQKATYAATGQFAAEQATRIAAEAVTPSVGPFGVGGKDLLQGFTFLSNAGQSSAKDIAEVSKALGLLGVAADQVGPKVTGAAHRLLSPPAGVQATTENLAAIAGSGFSNVDFSDTGASIPGHKLQYAGNRPTASLATITELSDAQKQAALAAVEQRQNSRRDQLGLSASSLLTQAQIKDIAQSGADGLREYLKGLGVPADKINEAARAYVQGAISGYRQQQENLANIAKGNFDPTTLAQIFDPKNGFGPYLDAELQKIGKLMSGPERTNEYRKILAQAQRVRSAAIASGNQTYIEQAGQFVDAAGKAWGDEAIAQFNQWIAHIHVWEKNNKHTQSQIKAKALELAKGLAATGNVDGLTALFNTLDKKTVNYIVAQLDAAAKLAAYARALEQEAQAAADAALAELNKALSSGQGGAIKAEGPHFKDDAAKAAADAERKSKAAQAQAAKAAANAKDATAHAAQAGSAPTGSAETWPKDKSASGDTAAQIAAARAEAQAIPGDDLSQARAALKAAQINLGAAKKNTVEYWNDVKALHEAQYQLATVEQKLANENYLLGHDITNPVVQAHAKVLADLAKLRYDQRRGANTTDDRLQLRQDQAAEQRTRFDQALQDHQTNYELGRESFQAYMRYLESQHNYLTAIKHRTYQQQQELNEVDQAMKALTDQLQGQFNIGDIKIPTYYEVKRSIATGAGAGGLYQQVNNIQIDGTDISLVRKALEEILGSKSSATRTNVGRKS